MGPPKNSLERFFFYSFRIRTYEGEAAYSPTADEGNKDLGVTRRRYQLTRGVLGRPSAALARRHEINT
jgi:hypothetical protein